MTPPITVAKSGDAGHVGVRVALRSWSFGASITVQGNAAITTAEARELAVALVQAADAEDAKVAKKQAEDERRKKWRDREVAAGRIKIMKW